MILSYPKIKYANLCKPNHDVIVIQNSSGPLTLENVEKNGKNYKNLNIPIMKRVF